MSKTKWKIIFSALLLSSALLMTGCDKAGQNASGTQAADGELDTATKEIRQNDYRGGVKRTKALQTNVLAVMDQMKSNNTIIRQDSPNSFWTTDGYQDFVSTFLDIAIIDDTQWCNEEETSWEGVVKQMAKTKSSFTDSGDSEEDTKLKSGVSIVRNEKDDYSVLGVPATYTITIDNKVYSANNIGTVNYRILYDCDKDWCKAYAQMSILDGFPPSTLQLYEYQRVDDNTFVIQTSRERLMVVLAPAETDTDIREREITEFYYSKLVQDGQRSTFTPFELLPEVDNNGLALTNNATLNDKMVDSYPFMNLDGDLCSTYGANDSMFFVPAGEMSREWVFEDKALQQGIVYKNGILVVTTYNKLSTNYERFVYSRSDADTSGLQELEDLIQIDNLVGVQSVEITTPKPNDGQTATSEPAVSEPAVSTATSDTSATSDTGDTSSTSEITEDPSTSSTPEAVESAPETEVSEPSAETPEPAVDVPPAE